MSHAKGGDTRTIKVDYLARVEGEGAMYLEIRDNAVVDVKLKIFEPPRFFEGFLRGRDFREAPDITSRICGICPVAYQMSAIYAMEDACGIKVEGALRELRRLFYAGEWISSHTLHIYMLHAPDFLGYPSAVEMAKDHPEAVERGLSLKKIGCEIMSLMGGREIHPVNAKVGGFFRVPARKELMELREKLLLARDLARQTVEWSATLDFPAFEQDYTFVSLYNGEEYPMIDGRIISNKGLDIAVNEYDQHFEERHVGYSNALQCVMKPKGNCYHVGPMARYALNFAQLPADIQETARAAGLGAVCNNPFQSIIVRSVEVLYAVSEALRVIDNYKSPSVSSIPAVPKATTGYGATEAPRGLLYHRYTLDSDGIIEDANIVPPTSQNQKMIEDDLRRFVPGCIDKPDSEIQYLSEQAVRNYDPCISCATHFLKLEIDRK
ncbi:NAD-reducing hydrogenase HoxS subunit beta [Pseudovibrio axinellae]|uniref:NAD-reducing hydrogenase HoxS subunit beta n=1 Tax=Pseudovibrio axinellae TaxID=989403 RepID=A0A165WA41_9HYPH|nr:Ni/Fe hydrogenase subunit alpha [Pseudovibrio axinellae]KZL16271.1 NAD-reducing hydrogenase HoxS subunit beta [Pseudovibrio axinellae]SER78565.1 Coenzyme F420-reducing hydrogenase, alpha subunit [Pseudovibrio axinellae]